MTNQQKGMFLVGLLLAWGGITAYQVFIDSESATSSQSNITQPNVSLPTVQALALNPSFPNARQLVAFSQPRNIFSPIGSKKTVAKRTRPKSPPPSRTTMAPSPSPSPPPRASPSPEELAAQRARQQLNQFRFLGYLTKGGESQAFLTNGQAIYIVKQGEMLEGQVQVNKIEPENIVLSAEVWEAGSQVQATIPLTPETQS